jgi:glycosyltransferase involved in cell wall biosynthesis
MRILVGSSYGWWGDFTPDDLVSGVRQVGGGETAMVNISKELAGLGHEVIVFYDTKTGRYGGVDYLPTTMAVPIMTTLEHDVFVAWDASWLFRFNDRAKCRVLAFQLNDAQVGVYDWVIDKYFHPSQWHADRFHQIYPEITQSKQVARITNGIDYNRFVNRPLPKREWNRVVYSSSPDRGLHHLLRIWPNVVDRVPEAELHVYYDIDKWLEMDNFLGERNITHDRAVAVRTYRTASPKNVTFHGGIGQGQLSIEQARSAVLAYPCDPIAPTEGFSMTVLEGIVAGCNVIVSDADAFPELWSNAPGVTMLPLPIDDELWTTTIVNKLRNGNESRELQIRMEYSWTALARRWERELESCLSKR